MNRCLLMSVVLLMAISAFAVPLKKAKLTVAGFEGNSAEIVDMVPDPTTACGISKGYFAYIEPKKRDVAKIESDTTVGEGDRPITFTMKDSTVGFAKSQEEVFSVANVKTLALTNVTFRGANAPLARTWDGRPALELSNVKGAGSEIVGGKEPYECPMR